MRMLLLWIFAFAMCSRLGAAPLNYGFLYRYSHLLINKQDGDSIRMCGGHLVEYQRAIQKWGDALNRTYRFENECSNADVYIYGSWDEQAKKYCEKYKNEGIDLTGRVFTLNHELPMIVVDCGSQKKLEPVALHESGHLFGLCDQYAGEITKCTYTTTPSPYSVMAAAISTELTDDDIKGIRAYAKNITEGMIDSSIIKRSASFISMRSGAYERFDLPSKNTKVWNIESFVIEGETKAITIRDQESDYQFLCNPNYECTLGSAKIVLLTSEQFDFVSGDKTYPFRLIK